MIKLKNELVKLQSSELNIKQRVFEKQSIVTLELKTLFYPTLIDEQIVFGSIELTVDNSECKSLNDFLKTDFKDGKVVVNLNEDGKWNTYTFYDFKIKFIKIEENDISFELEFTDCKISEKANITSLYTIGNKNIAEYFDLSDFYEKPIVKEIANKEIFKFFKK